MASIEQEEKEAPGKFLYRLREALRRFTEIDPESEEGKVILKDRFLTQSAPDIRHKLLKQAYGPNQSLDNLLQLAQTVYYGREYEEKKERQKKTKEQAEALTMAMKTGLKQPEKNAQRDPHEKGWACYYYGKEGHLKRNCPQASKPPPPTPYLPNPPPQLHVRSAKDHTRRETAPRGIGFRGQTLKTNRTDGAGGVPTVPVLITLEEPRVLITVGVQSIDFLLDTGAIYSVLTEAPGPLYS